MVSHGFILKDEVFSGQLTLSSHVIPEAYGGVIARACRDDRPLKRNVEPINSAIVEAATDQLKLHLVVDGVSLPYALRPYEANIIVL